MNFYIMTLFPEMVMDGLNTSIIGRAVNKGLLSIEALNIRDYAFNKHHSVDAYPYGGGAGMLMQAEPVYQCYDALQDRSGKGKPGKKDPENSRTWRVERNAQESSICPRKGRHSTSLWQKNSHRKKILYSYADIMKGLTNVCWRRS